MCFDCRLSLGRFLISQCPPRCHRCSTLPHALTAKLLRLSKHLLFVHRTRSLHCPRFAFLSRVLTHTVDKERATVHLFSLCSQLRTLQSAPCDSLSSSVLSSFDENSRVLAMTSSTSSS